MDRRAVGGVGIPYRLQGGKGQVEGHKCAAAACKHRSLRVQEHACTRFSCCTPLRLVTPSTAQHSTNAGNPSSSQPAAPLYSPLTLPAPRHTWDNHLRLQQAGLQGDVVPPQLGDARRQHPLRDLEKLVGYTNKTSKSILPNPLKIRI